MNATFTPEKICADVANNKLTKEVATELLISLIDQSPDNNIRIQSIEAFLNLSLNSDKAFRIIENCLISDENSLVRNAAAKVMFHNFLKNKNFLPLKYAVRHENSPIVIRTLLDMFKSSKDDPHFIIFSEQINERLMKIYKIPSKDIDFKLNLEVIYTEYANDYKLKAGDTWFKIIGMLKNLSSSTDLIQRLYYLKLGGKKFSSFHNDSIHYLKSLLFKTEKS